jgi:subtilisin family serine protease
MEEIYAPEGLYLIQDIEIAQALDEAELLAYVEPNYYVELLDIPDDTALQNGLQWDLSMIGMEYAWDNHITGSGVRIGVIDSGVNADHEDLQTATILTGRNYCVDTNNGVEGGTEDDVGHGTFVTGIIAAATNNALGIAGIAPDAEIVPLKAFKMDRGQTVGTVASVSGAIWGAVDRYGCQVLNLSLGTNNDTKTLKNAINHAAKKGVILIAAAGNQGTDQLFYPAAYDNVIGVGAVDCDQDVAWFSQRNATVFLTAPGKDLYGLSSYTYGTGSGTSYAAPIVTAAVALALSVAPDLTQEQFQSLLQQTAEDLGDDGYDTSYGWGLLRVDRMLDALQNFWVDDEDTSQLSIWRSGLESEQTVLVTAAAYSEAGQLLSITMTPAAASESGVLTTTLYDIRRTQAYRVQIMILDPNTWMPLLAEKSERQIAICGGALSES